MHRRLKSFELRLARIAGFLRDQAAEVEEAQAIRHGRQVIAALIRDGLERAGLDPAEARTLRALETREPPPPPRRWRRRDPHDAFFATVQTLADRMTGPPALASASPMALLAYYCFGRGAREAPA